MQSHPFCDYNAKATTPARAPSARTQEPTFRDPGRIAALLKDVEEAMEDGDDDDALFEVVAEEDKMGIVLTTLGDLYIKMLQQGATHRIQADIRCGTEAGCRRR